MMRKVFLFMIMALALAACAVPFAPVPAATSTETPTASKIPKRTRLPAKKRPTATPQPVKTAATAPFVVVPAPSETLPAPPSPTSGPQPALTPTILAPSPTPTATVQSDLACKLLWQSPSNSGIFAPDDKFSAGWDVRNIGTATWDAQSVEFVYLGGAKLHNDELSHLDTSVAPGDDIVLSVPMKAPRHPTRYTTYWGLRQGDTYFCRLMLSIFVIED